MSYHETTELFCMIVVVNPLILAIKLNETEEPLCLFCS